VSILTFLLMLAVIAAVVYGIKLALAQRWQDLIIMVVVLLLILWVLSAFGLTLPDLPTAR